MISYSIICKRKFGTDTLQAGIKIKMGISQTIGAGRHSPICGRRDESRKPPYDFLPAHLQQSPIRHQLFANPLLPLSAKCAQSFTVGGVGFEQDQCIDYSLLKSNCHLTNESDKFFGRIIRLIYFFLKIIRWLAAKSIVHTDR